MLKNHKIALGPALARRVAKLLCEQYYTTASSARAALEAGDSNNAQWGKKRLAEIAKTLEETGLNEVLPSGFLLKEEEVLTRILGSTQP